MSYQTPNVHNLSRTDDTIVFSIFEDKDYRSSIKIMLTRYWEQVKVLQNMA